MKTTRGVYFARIIKLLQISCHRNGKIYFNGNIFKILRVELFQRNHLIMRTARVASLWAALGKFGRLLVRVGMSFTASSRKKREIAGSLCTVCSPTVDVSTLQGFSTYNIKSYFAFRPDNFSCLGSAGGKYVLAFASYFV